MTRTKSFPMSVCLNAILQICGTARPIKAIGPTKAVADALSIADETNISQRVFLTLIPIVCA